MVNAAAGIDHAKELLRKAFESGALDVTYDYETVREFVRVFAGDPIAIRAIDLCNFLTDHQYVTLRSLASPDT